MKLNLAIDFVLPCAGSGLLLAVVLALSAACGDDPVAKSCSNIPAGGCPLDGPSVCDDVTCQAVYACNTDGTWSIDSVCMARDAGMIVDAGPPDTAKPVLRDAGPPIPGASGGPGCEDLEPPDCPLGIGLSCPPDSCCGCEDLFVCADGGWNSWGSCAEGGTLVGHDR